ncbi:MAG: 3'(2'),5'-bisphosphate nucleotidase CysQ [Bacteroidota bacterium]
MQYLETLVNSVKRIAVLAGKVIMEVYQDEASFGITHKKDDSPLTVADQRANRLICDELVKISPEIPIISEENKAIPYEERKTFEYAWLVDPVDGTKEFIKRNGEFTVNIALIHHGKIVLGVVYVPVSKELFWATKGSGAFRQVQESDEAVNVLTAPRFTMKDKGLKVVCSRSHLNEGTANFIAQLNQPEKVSKGSSLKFLILAQGQAHLYPRLAPTMEWDTGAAHIILEEAGGKVISEDTVKPLYYNKENLLNPYFIAYGNVQEVG